MVGLLARRKEGPANLAILFDTGGVAYLAL